MDRLLDPAEYQLISQDPMVVRLTSSTNPTSLRLITAAVINPYYVSHDYDTEHEHVTITLSGSLDQFLDTLEV